MSSEHNAPGVKAYGGVLAALLVGTFLTVQASYWDLGHWGNVLLGLGIASIKASLVAFIFMQMKYEKRWWTAFLIFPFILVAIIICANMPDTGLNGEPDLPQGFTTPAVIKPIKEHAEHHGGNEHGGGDHH